LSTEDTIKALTALNQKQAEQISALLSHVENLETVIERQDIQISSLVLRVEDLEQELSVHKNRKNSGNSHLPPSSDLSAPKRNQSLREKSDRKPGGQDGHEGHALKMNEQPDEIIKHTPCVCGGCGNDLSGFTEHLIARRQVVDIPPIKPVYTEHRVYRKSCSCGYITESSFPSGIKAPVVYGPNVETMIAYLHARQYLPFERMAELLYYTMGLSISTGCLANMVLRFAEKAKCGYQEIKNGIEQAGYVGADETGVKVNGLKHWYWTWQNKALTYIVHSTSRGYDTIENNFSHGLPNAVLVHDRWAAQLKCPAKEHQICLAHLLRDLNYIEQLHKSDWAIAFKIMIKAAIALDNELLENQYLMPNTTRDALQFTLLQLLEQPLPATHKKAISLQKKLVKIKHNILTFLHHPDVPADNNGSEGAIRNAKVKLKISGQFKSAIGAQAFAIIRSIIDTAIKSGKVVFSELLLIANLVPE
jgi:transposase